MDSYENKETKPFRPAVLSFVESLDSKCSNMETYGICSNMEYVVIWKLSFVELILLCPPPSLRGSIVHVILIVHVYVTGMRLPNFG